MKLDLQLYTLDGQCSLNLSLRPAYVLKAVLLLFKYSTTGIRPNLGTGGQ